MKTKWVFRSLSVGLLFLTSCFGSKEESVWGIVSGAYYGAPTRTEIVTKPARDGGVKLSTDVGKGKNAVMLSEVESVRLISAMEAALAAWRTYWRQDPFERTLVMGVTSETDWTPYSVELVRSEEMSDPIFRVTIGRDKEQGSVVLDEENARRWLSRLREASGGGPPPYPTPGGPPPYPVPSP